MVLHAFAILASARGLCLARRLYSSYFALLRIFSFIANCNLQHLQRKLNIILILMTPDLNDEKTISFWTNRISKMIFNKSCKSYFKGDVQTKISFQRWFSTSLANRISKSLLTKISLPCGFTFCADHSFGWTPDEANNERWKLAKNAKITKMPK